MLRRYFHFERKQTKSNKMWPKDYENLAQFVNFFPKWSHCSVLEKGPTVTCSHVVGGALARFFCHFQIFALLPIIALTRIGTKQGKISKPQLLKNNCQLYLDIIGFKILAPSSFTVTSYSKASRMVCLSVGIITKYALRRLKFFVSHQYRLSNFAFCQLLGCKCTNLTNKTLPNDPIYYIPGRASQRLGLMIDTLKSRFGYMFGLRIFARSLRLVAIWSPNL